MYKRKEKLEIVEEPERKALPMARPSRQIDEPSNPIEKLKEENRTLWAKLRK